MASRRAPRQVPSAGVLTASLTMLGLGIAALTAGCPSDPVPINEQVCPNSVPAVGDACTKPGLACSYANTTGCTTFFVATCEADSTWSWDNGCGGGGGSGGNTGAGGTGGQMCNDSVPGPPTVTSPQSVTYAPDAASYRLELSEAVMNVSSNLTWAGTGSINTVIKLDAQTYLVKFTGMTPGTTSTLTVGTGVTDTCSNPLASAVAIDITLLPRCHLFGQDFEGDFESQGWAVVDDAATGQVWARSDLLPPAGVPNHTAGSGLCASVGNHDGAGGSAWDTSLVSPAIDLTTVPNAAVSYQSDFVTGYGSGQATLEASADGVSWDPVSYWYGDRGPGLEIADLSPYVGGQVYLRWRYVDPDGSASFWDVDDVCVEQFTVPTCPCPALAYKENHEDVGGADGNGAPWLAEETQKSVTHKSDRILVCGTLEDDSGSGPDYYHFSVASDSDVARYYVTTSYCLEDKFDQATVELWSSNQGVPVGGDSAAHGEGSFTATLPGADSYYISLTANGTPYPSTKYQVTVRVDGVLGPKFVEDFEDWPPLYFTVDSESPCLNWDQVDQYNYSVHPPGVIPPKGYYMARLNSHDCAVGFEGLEVSEAQDFLSSDAIVLSFAMYHDTEFPAALDSIQVQYKIAASWINIGPAIARPAAVEGWTTESVDLSALVGKNAVKLRLLGTTAYGNDILIDNVALLTEEH
jgi:hypothetical protein